MEAGLDQTEVGRLISLVESFGGPPIAQHSARGLGHRLRARLSIRGRVGDCRIGIFEAKSHRLVHIPDCPIHHPVLSDFLLRCVDYLNDAGVEPYDEARHLGLLRGMQLALERRSQTLQVVLLLRDDLSAPSALQRSLRSLVEVLHADLAVGSLWLGALPHRNNSLQASHYELVFGPPLIVDQSGGVDVYYPPDAFGQANLEMHDAMVERIHQLISPGLRVVEYYAGVGTIGLGWAAQQNEVLFNEVGAGSVRGLGHGWRQLQSTGRVRGDVRLSQGRAGEHAALYAPADCVIVDPPRKGLDAALLDRLCSVPPREIIYLSCGLESLITDASRLLNSGRYALTHVTAAAYFPFTRHVESLIRLQRS